MKRQTIQVATNNGGWKRNQPDAVIYGPFGVHPSPDLPGRFVVTHLNTGYAAAHDAPTERDGLSLARRLVATGLPWTFKSATSRACLRTCRKAKEVKLRWQREIAERRKG